MKKNSLLVLMLVLGVIFATAGRSMPEAAVTLEVWIPSGLANLHRVISAAGEVLQENHPETDINVNVKYEDVHRRISIAAKDEAPDLAMVKGEKLSMGKELFTDLHKRIPALVWATTEISLEDWYEPFRELVFKGEKVFYMFDWALWVPTYEIYGVYYLGDGLVLWYWKDLLEEAGIDPEGLAIWDGFKEAAMKSGLCFQYHQYHWKDFLEDVVIDGTVRVEGMLEEAGIGLGDARSNLALSFMLMNGCISTSPCRPWEWWAGEQCVRINESACLEALEFLKQIIPSFGWQLWQRDSEEFLHRRCALLIGSAGRPDVPLGKIGMLRVRPLPVPEPRMRPYLMPDGWAWVMPKGAEHKELSSELLSILLSPEFMAKAYIEVGGGIPVRRALAEPLKPHYLVFAELVPNYRRPPKCAMDGRVREAILEISGKETRPKYEIEIPHPLIRYFEYEDMYLQRAVDVLQQVCADQVVTSSAAMRHSSLGVILPKDASSLSPEDKILALYNQVAIIDTLTDKHVGEGLSDDQKYFLASLFLNHQTRWRYLSKAEFEEVMAELAEEIDKNLREIKYADIETPIAGRQDFVTYEKIYTEATRLAVKGSAKPDGTEVPASTQLVALTTELARADISEILDPGNEHNLIYYLGQITKLYQPYVIEARRIIEETISEKVMHSTLREYANAYFTLQAEYPYKFRQLHSLLNPYRPIYFADLTSDMQNGINILLVAKDDLERSGCGMSFSQIMERFQSQLPYEGVDFGIHTIPETGQKVDSAKIAAVILDGFKKAREGLPKEEPS